MSANLALPTDPCPEGFLAKWWRKTDHRRWEKLPTAEKQQWTAHFKGKRVKELDSNEARELFHSKEHFLVKKRVSLYKHREAQKRKPEEEEEEEQGEQGEQGEEGEGEGEGEGEEEEGEEGGEEGEEGEEGDDEGEEGEEGDGEEEEGDGEEEEEEEPEPEPAAAVVTYTEEQMEAYRVQLAQSFDTRCEELHDKYDELATRYNAVVAEKRKQKSMYDGLFDFTAKRMGGAQGVEHPSVQTLIERITAAAEEKEKQRAARKRDRGESSSAAASPAASPAASAPMPPAKKAKASPKASPKPPAPKPAPKPPVPMPPVPMPPSKAAGKKPAPTAAPAAARKQQKAAAAPKSPPVELVPHRPGASLLRQGVIVRVAHGAKITEGQVLKVSFDGSHRISQAVVKPTGSKSAPKVVGRDKITHVFDGAIWVGIHWANDDDDDDDSSDDSSDDEAMEEPPRPKIPGMDDDGADDSDDYDHDREDNPLGFD